MTILFVICSGILSGLCLFLYFNRRDKVGELQFCMNMLEEKINDIGVLAELLEQAQDKTTSLEHALNLQLVARSSEVGSPSPSGAYYTLFDPTGNGKVLMIYMCLDTGHIARWHFQNVESLECEGNRLLKVAKQVQEGSLIKPSEMPNIHIGNDGVIH